MNPIVLVPIAAIFGVALYLGRNELIRRKLTCPATETLADVELFQRAQHPEKPVSVKSCSLLPDAKKIECDEACLKQPTRARRPGARLRRYAVSWRRRAEPVR